MKDEAKQEIIFLPKKVKAYTTNQRNYIRAIEDATITICYGPAGTGKTWMACGIASQLYKSGVIKKIVLTRPAIECGPKMGFLPGEAEDKLGPFIRPLYDALGDFFPLKDIHCMVEQGEIELVPLAFMRGRTLNGSFIILDEGQNSSVGEMKMFLTRIGAESKIVITGDITQSDLENQSNNYITTNGLKHAVEKLQHINNIKIIEFNDRDQMRNPIIEEILNVW